MTLPLSFLLGLAVLLLQQEVDDGLPGSESVLRLASSAVLSVLPWVVARLTARRVRRVVLAGGVPRHGLRLALRLQSLAVPLAYGVIVVWGELPAFVARLFPSSHFGQLAALLLPLLAMELSLRVAERRSVRWLEVAGLLAPSHLGTERVPMSLFLALPILGFAALADLVTLQRGLEVFFTATTLGSTLALLAVVLGMCALLPLLFRGLMPVTPTLPPHLAESLGQTAAALGFPPRKLLAMRTRHRFVNAALVGPLPWPRYLVMTDGLLSLLDRDALRGVVAHEVGHARANHPGLLVAIFTGFPLLLYQPREHFRVLEEAGTWSWVAVVSVALAGLRLLAHRFELEADQLSSEALGGAIYCVQALQRVGELSPHGMQRASFRHPSEAKRIRNLYACESDPAARRRFWRRGRWLRRGLWTSLALAAVAFAWAQVQLWPLDRAVWLFHNARFAEAHSRLQALPADLVARRRPLVEDLQREVSAAMELDLPPGPWEEVRPVLVREALERARVQLVERSDPAAALPWLSLALHQPVPEPWLVGLYRYSHAVAAEGEDATARIRSHLQRIGLPEGWRAALDE